MPSSQATRMTAAAFCVVDTSGRPSPTMALLPMPSAGSISDTLRASPSLAIRALLTAFARGFTSCSCMFLRTSLTSGRSAVRSMAIAMACARVTVFLLMWYLLVPRGAWPFALAPLTINIIRPSARLVNDNLPSTVPSHFDHDEKLEH